MILSNTASFHPRNKHKGRYDFEKLVQQHPPLKAYLKTTSDKKKSDEATIDFSDANSPLGNAPSDACANYCITLFSDLTRYVTMQHLFHDGGFSKTAVTDTVMNKFIGE